MSRMVYYDSRGNEIYPEPESGVVTTNADRIRAMTDEELAKFLLENVDCNYCTMHGEGCSIDCEEWMRSWLKSPVEEEQT